MAEYVTVLCRLPSGVILDLYDSAVLSQRAQSVNPPVTAPAPIRSVTLNGIKHDPRFHIVSNKMLGMAGRTEVDAEFWTAWLAQNKENQLVTKGLVFAERNSARAEAALQERANERTGLEGNDPKKDIEGTSRLSEEVA